MAVIPGKPALVVHPHALVGDGTIHEGSTFLINETLGAYIKRTGVIVPAGPVAVWHNGFRVPDALWRRLIPRQGDQVIIRARVLGGGGGGKVLRTVAMIALVVVTQGAFGWQGLGAMVGSGLGIGAGLGSALVMIGGALMINALLPPPTATATQLGTGSKYESSPTYAISGGRNRMRPWEPMTIIFGRHKVVPDLGAQYYTEFVGDDQYLNQVFHFGLQAGAIDLQEYKIGDTPVLNYQGVQLQGPDAAGRLTMFPGNVDTLQGFALASGVWNARTTPIDTNYISVELASQLFYVRDDGGIDARSVDIRIQYRNLAGGAWADIGMLSDAVYATHYWALMKRVYVQVGDSGSYYTEIQAQYGSTNPGDHTDGEQVVITPWRTSGAGDNEYYIPPVMGTWRWKPHPYQLGQPWQGLAPDPLLGHSVSNGVRLTGARQEPTRRTIGWSVAQGQYEVRVMKVSADIKTSRESNDSAVSQILCYQPDNADYTGQLRIALRIKATSQLNGAVDEFNAIAYGYCPIWDGSVWTWGHTRNPAWWFREFAEGRFAADGSRIFGGGMADSQIDYEAIKAWGLWCDAKGLTFDYVLDRKISTAQMLQIIARAGRASPTWQTGKLGVIWDAANQPVVAMFSPFNIKPGSFNVAYIGDSTADEIVMNFINPDRGWAMDEVRVRVPGATTTNNPLQLDFDGCTSAAMAGREANLLAASQVWHRRRVTWETDIEGWVANRGDVVQISHDLTVWGYSGRLTGRDGNNITLSTHVPSDTYGIMLIRGPENQMRTVAATTMVVGDVETVTISSDMTGFPLPGDDGYEGVPAMDWAFFFDPISTPGRRFKITEVQPSEDGVKFTAIDDDPEYYASENNPYVYMPPRDGTLLSGIVFAITFAETIVNVQADITNIQIGWALSSAMRVQVVVSINGQAQSAINTEDRNVTVQAQTGDVISVTVTPKPAAGSSGAPGTQQYVVQGLTAPLPAVTGLTNIFRDGLTALVWNRVVDIRQPEYEIRIGPSWDNARTVGIVPTLDALAVGNGLYWVAARFASRGYVVYGPADSLSIQGATLVRNVLATINEHPDWDGTLGGGAIINEGLLTLSGTGDFLAVPDVLTMDDVLWYGGVISGGTYQTAAENIIDIGYATPVRIDFEMEEYALNFGENFLTIPDILAYPDVLNVSNRQHYKVRPQIRHAQDDGVFSDWQDYIPGLINARYFDVRLLLETDDPLLVPFVVEFTWTIDVPDLVQQGIEIAVPVTGLRITYPKEFHTDDVSPQIAIYDAENNSRARFYNTSRTGFDIELLNNTTPIEGKINWLSQRY